MLKKVKFNPSITSHEVVGNDLLNWSLRPASAARSYPDYIPAPLRQDYEEACAIRDISPKASATLSRRCLQGIIRDYWDITKPRLIEEIAALQSITDPLTWSAIDAVRSIGNIGAHMEKDINLIIEVDPKEASMLIGLIETLFKDCYIARHQREEHLKAITEVAETKAAARKKAT